MGIRMASAFSAWTRIINEEEDTLIVQALGLIVEQCSACGPDHGHNTSRLLGLHYKTLWICNVQKIGRIHSELSGYCQ